MNNIVSYNLFLTNVPLFFQRCDMSSDDPFRACFGCGDDVKSHDRRRNDFMILLIAKPERCSRQHHKVADLYMQQKQVDVVDAGFASIMIYRSEWLATEVLYKFFRASIIWGMMMNHRWILYIKFFYCNTYGNIFQLKYKIFLNIYVPYKTQA